MDRLKEALENSRAATKATRYEERSSTPPKRGSVRGDDATSSTTSSWMQPNATNATSRRPGSSSGTRMPLLYTDHPLVHRPTTSSSSSSSSSSEFKFGPRFDDYSNGISSSDNSFGIFNFRSVSSLDSLALASNNDSSSISSFSNGGGSTLAAMALKSKNDDTLRRESRSDSLLRIFDTRKGQQIDDLIVAAESGDLAGMQSLLKSKFSNQASAQSGDFSSAKGSSKAPNSFNMNEVRGSGGFSLLHYAANRGHINIIALLLSYEISIDIRNDNNETPLHLAVYNGHLLAVDLLISENADVNARNSDKETPLFYAARRSFPAVIRLLLQRRADISLEDDLGESAVGHCTDSRCLAAIQSYSRIVKDEGNCEAQTPLLSQSILVRIFSWLPPKDVCRCALVNSIWHFTSESAELQTGMGLHRIRLENSLLIGTDTDMPASAAFLLKSKRSSKSFN